MVGIRSFPLGMTYFQGLLLLVSGRVVMRSYFGLKKKTLPVKPSNLKDCFGEKEPLKLPAPLDWKKTVVSKPCSVWCLHRVSKRWFIGLTPIHRCTWIEVNHHANPYGVPQKPLPEVGKIQLVRERIVEDERLWVDIPETLHDVFKIHSGNLT